MGVRTTSSDPTDFIYDSVTGYAIGPNWTDAEEMEAFLTWWLENHSTDLRILTNTEVKDAIALWRKLPTIGNEYYEAPNIQTGSVGNVE